MFELLEEEQEKLKHEHEALEQERESWSKALVCLEATQLEDPVILNVGGARFATSLETLTRVQNTYFSALLSGRWDLKRSKLDGSIFIDRDPTVFGYIINYLRESPEQFYERLKLLNAAERKLLRLDCEFYLLTDLLRYVSFLERFFSHIFQFWFCRKCFKREQAQRLFHDSNATLTCSYYGGRLSNQDV